MGALMGAFHAAGNVSTGKSPEASCIFPTRHQTAVLSQQRPLSFPSCLAQSRAYFLTRDRLLTSQSLGSSSGTTITQEIRDDRRKSWFKREPKFTQLAEQGQVA